MKRSVWIPLAAAGVALAGVAAGVMRALKKQKETAEEPVVDVEGEDVVEVEVTDECCGCCEAEAPAEAPEAPAENAEPAADGETPAEE